MNLNQITLPVREIGRSRDFYRKLGFRLIVDAPHYCRFEAPAGDATLSIHADAGPIGTGAVLYLETADLDAEAARLKAAGLSFDHPPADQTWLWREARFSDPDGHQWVLYFAGDNRKNPPWRVKPTAPPPSPAETPRPHKQSPHPRPGRSPRH